jgi:pimeloyl-ACP methyl ester carboxylesterase
MQASSQRAADPKKATAGLRGASWTASRLPADVRTSVHTLATQDGAQITGFLYSRGGEKTAVSLMHPRELIATHYLVPDILLAGCACWVQGSRSVGNDVRLEHEIALFDVAAGLNFLRDAGFEKLVLLGNSGGAALFALYLQQSSADPARRIAKTPGGRPTKLAEANLPVAERLILVAPHLGPGKLLQNCIDPSVVDEADPTAIDSSLFPFSAENGFKRPPQSASYTKEFVQRYRQAQRERVERIDDRAKAMIDERLRARGAAKEGADLQTRIRGAHTPIFQVWRTDADPRCFDLSLDASDRKWGTVWGNDPLASNFGSVGFGRSCTAESWLSTWSGLSSNASFDKCGPAIELPTLMIDYTGDNTVFPSDGAAIFASLRTNQKSRSSIRGNHHGQPLAEGDPSGQLLAGEAIQEFLRSNR